MTEKKVGFKAIDPLGNDTISLEGYKAALVLKEGDNEFIVPCFLHKKDRLWYVFERETGLGISMSGQKNRFEALSHAAAMCYKFGGIAATERAINGALKLRGQINA